jgi:hypothetical protein
MAKISIPGRKILPSSDSILPTFGNMHRMLHLYSLAHPILPLVSYGCETWSLTLKEEQRLRVLENRVLRRIFGPKRLEVAGGWRGLHNVDLHNLYASPNIIKVMKWRRMRLEGHVARVGKM